MTMRHLRPELSKWVCSRVCWSPYIFVVDFKGVWLRRCLGEAPWYCTYLPLSWALLGWLEIAIPKCPPQPSSRMTSVPTAQTANQLRAWSLVQTSRLWWNKVEVRFRNFKSRWESHEGFVDQPWNPRTGFMWEAWLCNLPLLVFNANGTLWACGCSQQGKLRFAPVMGTSLLGDPVKAKGRARQTLQLLGTQGNCLRSPRKNELPLPGSPAECRES